MGLNNRQHAVCTVKAVGCRFSKGILATLFNFLFICASLLSVYKRIPVSQQQKLGVFVTYHLAINITEVLRHCVCSLSLKR